MTSDVRLAVVGEVGGRFSHTCDDRDIAYFVEKCARAGIQRIIHSYYHYPSPKYPSYLTHGNQLMQVEPFAYGAESPLARLVRRAHDAGIEVISFVNVATGGQWIRADYLASGEVWPYVRLIGGGRELDKYWARTRDGRSWLDHGPRSPLGAVGYVSLAYPEVRERERNLYLEFVDQYRVDGVQLEFMISRPPRYASPSAHRNLPCCDEEGYWAYGYEEPAIEEYRQKYGVDPCTLPNSEPSWVQFRADYATQHLRELRQALQQQGKHVDVSVFAFSGTFSSSADGLAVGSDWETWLREGLIDTIYSRIPGDRPPLRERFTEVRVEGMQREYLELKKAVAGRAALFPVIELPTYPLSAPGQGTPEEANAGAERLGHALLAAGADRLGFWWFDTIEALDLWPTVAMLRAALEKGAQANP
ncbi:MAG: family 10 glycosylhydrolase [Ardenticatenaceae bacterium]|nr:family 10 glycosylhydrolase [Ardenticatenaceae bacterium]HBY97751.1 hypothetical protein [Chloroflexota bacterium]